MTTRLINLTVDQLLAGWRDATEPKFAAVYRGEIVRRMEYATRSRSRFSLLSTPGASSTVLLRGPLVSRARVEVLGVGTASASSLAIACDELLAKRLAKS